MQRSYRIGLSRGQKMVALGAAAALLPTLAQAAPVTMTATDSAGASSWTTGTRWSDATAPNAANDYYVPSGLALRPPPDSGDTVFAGNSLTVGNNGANNGTLTIKNVTNTSVTVNNFTLNKGEIQNGGNAAGTATTITLISNGITVDVGGGVINTAGVGRALIINAPISGSGALTTANAGTTTLNGNNSGFSGTFTLSGNAAQLLNIGTSTALGTGTFAISNGNTASFDNTSGAAMTLAANNPLTWNNNFTFVGSNDLNLGTGAVAMNGVRTLTVNNRVLTVGGDIAGAANSLTVLGTGVLALNGNNVYSGGTTIGAANATLTTLRAGSSNALGTGVINILGNNNGGRLELTNNVTINNSIILSAKTTAGDPAGILSSSGNNTLGGQISLTTGGNNYMVQSDAGLLTLSAPTAISGVALGGNRLLVLQGAGNGLVSGVISPGTGGLVLNVTKAGAGTWTLSGNNTYTGVTTVSAGTLALGASNVIADASAVNLAGGTLATGGYDDTLGQLDVSANSTIDLGNGASTLTFASAAGSWAGALTVDNWTSGVDQLIVLGTLTQTQLDAVTFAGAAQPGALQLVGGELIPVPEPTTLAALGLGALVLRRRR